MSIKIERINNILVQEISYVINNEVKDSDVKFVTITDVDASKDLSYAKVYFTVLDDTKKESTTKALNNASRFVRSQLFDRVDMRNVPELSFVYDESIATGKHIEDLIEGIHN